LLKEFIYIKIFPLAKNSYLPDSKHDLDLWKIKLSMSILQIVLPFKIKELFANNYDNNTSCNSTIANGSLKSNILLGSIH